MALNMKDLITARETESDILVIYYNILVFYLLSAGNRYLTRSILNEMEAKSLPFNDATYIDDGKPSIETWSLLVHKLCQEGRTSEAEELLHAMLAAGEIPGREMYSCVIESHRSENNLRNASEVMGMMQRSGYDPDFESHWSLISNLSTSSMGKEDDNDKTSGGFLTGLLFGSGHPVRTRSNPNKINKPL
ncbi:unnamed protein product [Linum tenue]|uniref:Pentatricopeptide repeat-containing protein n=1 Tax=Linum tenue TaxID=586396 RepID=A0AAV0N689_9ROSI|nr:unnamed protein product [Linum tenue]